MKKIIPSIIAKSRRELDEITGRILKFSGIFHLDVMDGRFVKNKSLFFDFRLPENKKYQAHLMIERPKTWIKKNAKKTDAIIFHYESLNSPDEVNEVINLIVSQKNGVGLAVNPETPARKIFPFMKKINFAVVMTVKPGRYGAGFLPETLKKIRQLKKEFPKIRIQADGGMNDETIPRTSEAGADFFTVGSFIQNSPDAGKTIKELKSFL